MNKVYSEGNAPTGKKKAELHVVELDQEQYFKISNHDAMRPFFMSVVSDSNHWMFVSSNGALSAGRKNPEYALFPYYTDDKITESYETTGSKTIFQVKRGEEKMVWEPFSERFTGKYSLSRNLYKSIYGNTIVFEEVNHDLELSFRYQWCTGKIFGFIRKAELVNHSDKPYSITLLDGIQNIMPYGVPSDLQRSTSNLVDGYKRNELEAGSGIGIFALSAIIVDKAEPSEALKANIAWALGLEKPKHLLSSQQVDRFRQQQSIQEEHDIKGEKGAYFVSSEISLPQGATKKWKILANVNQNHAQIVSLAKSIREDNQLEKAIQYDIESGTQNLKKLVSHADGMQFTADQLNDTRHYSNVLFNIMRGGIFDDNYTIKKKDFVSYLTKANKNILSDNADFLEQLPAQFTVTVLKELLITIKDADLIRLAIEYLPLKFSRRHGDPSRPWNYFTINIQDENDGSEILDYEGNWRDIFQNWEALACSYPGFIEGMIFKFLNASTFDGYNPYRVTKDGFDWETIEPDNPWSYIGYWGDHQIIYLLKFLEIIEKHQPGTLQSWFDKEWFVYAAVPYVIKPYPQILKDPKNTIEFDHQWDEAIRSKREKRGADGALLTTANEKTYHVNLMEKLMATLLTKVSNLIPEGGIWMNTQRPEWNDANNALVGNGVSMVTLYYMRRFISFFRKLLESSSLESVKVSTEMIDFYHSLREALYAFRPSEGKKIDDKERKHLMDQMGTAASDYRQHIYKNGFWGKKRSISLSGLKKFTETCLDFTDHSIRANKREDKLYHAYNLVHLTPQEASCSHLSEMLEGQVAVLSSGFLSAEESLEVLDALKSSALFREDQYSYILYPNKELPGFLHKNTIAAKEAQSSTLIQKMIDDDDRSIVEKDIEGEIHFNGNFKNARDLIKALDNAAEGKFAAQVKQDRELLLALFEKVFNHRAFTGRSGTFFAFEGLGSIYWHMVSKLLLATQECCLQAIEQKADPVIVGKLLDHYYEIGAGIGVHKSPELYGAFPTDPYSHTPQHKGAQQPGMTGQVKEDVLARYGELGVFVKEGQLYFKPDLLRKDEFLKESQAFEYINVKGDSAHIHLKENELAFTYCAVPVIYSSVGKKKVVVSYTSGKQDEFNGHTLPPEVSRIIFNRNGEVEKIKVELNQ